MQQNFDKALQEVLKHEGGWSDHPQDPGGATNMGITIATYRKWIDRNGTPDDLKKISHTQVAKIYRSAYWNAVKGDELPSGIDYAVFDFGVNSGTTRAAKYLQAVLGVEQDGKIGPLTIAAAHKADAEEVIDSLCDRRMAFLRGLKTFATFGKGWTRRVNDVRALALKMARPIIGQPIPHLGPKEPPVDVWQPDLEPNKGLGIPALVLIVFAAIAAAVVFFFVPIGG